MSSIVPVPFLSPTAPSPILATKRDLRFHHLIDKRLRPMSELPIITGSLPEQVDGVRFMHAVITSHEVNFDFVYDISLQRGYNVSDINDRRQGSPDATCRMMPEVSINHKAMKTSSEFTGTVSCLNS